MIQVRFISTLDQGRRVQSFVWVDAERDAPDEHELGDLRLREADGRFIEGQETHYTDVREVARVAVKLARERDAASR